MFVCVGMFVCVSSLTPLAKPLVVFREKLWPKTNVDPSGLPSTLRSHKQHRKFYICEYYHVCRGVCLCCFKHVSLCTL